MNPRAPTDFTSHRPWPELPTDLLVMISRRLTDVIDYVQFRSVCSSWRSAAKPSGLPPQFPLLLLPHTTDSVARSFYNISLGRTSTSEFPETRNKTICGSSFGWLTLIDADDCALSLWNPFTRAQIHLPSPSQIDAAVSKYKGEHRRPWKVYLSNNPLGNIDCVVIALLCRSRKFAYCGLGEETWTIVDSALSLAVCAVVLHGGSFFAFNCFAACAVIDLTASKETILLPPPEEAVWVDWLRVVEIPDEGLLVVSCYHRMDDPNRRDQLKVFKLDTRGGRLEWSGMRRRLGDYAVFLSAHHSSIVSAIAFPGCREDYLFQRALRFSTRQTSVRSSSR